MTEAIRVVPFASFQTIWPGTSIGEALCLPLVGPGRVHPERVEVSVPCRCLPGESCAVTYQVAGRSAQPEANPVQRGVRLCVKGSYGLQARMSLEDATWLLSSQTRISWILSIRPNGLSDRLDSRRADSEPLHLQIQPAAGEAEKPRCFRDVAVGACQRALDHLALEQLDGRWRGWCAGDEILRLPSPGFSAIDAKTGERRSGVIRPPGSAMATARCTSLRS